MIKKGRVRQFDAWYLGSLPSDGTPTLEKATACFRLIKARLQDKLKRASAKAAGKGGAQEKRRSIRARRSSNTLRGKTITLVLTAEGFRTLDAATRSTLFSAFVSHVELVCAFCDSDSNHEVLSICIKTPMLGRCVNHIFVCAPGQADAIAALMKTAQQHMTPQKTMEKYFNSEASALYGSDVNMEVSAMPMVKELPRDCIVPVAPIVFGRFGPIGVGCIADMEDGQEQLELYSIRCLRPDSPESDWAEFANECALLATLHHDHIVSEGG
jgi:hypothetical protein